MGERDLAVAGAARAKALRPSDSGVYRAVHVPDDAAANDASPQDPSSDPVPAHARSGKRAGMSRALASLLAGATRADGLFDGDVAAACDRSRPHVVDMRRPDGRAITLADAVLIARVSPSWRAALVDLIGGVE